MKNYLFILFIMLFSLGSLHAQSLGESYQRALKGEQLSREERKTITQRVFSYLREPTKEKEELLKKELLFNERLQASPLSGIEDGIMDHVRRVTKSLGIIDDFGAPVIELLKSIEQGAVQSILEYGPEGVSAKDLTNISTIVYKLAVNKINQEAISQPKTAIMVSEADKTKLLNYLFALDLLRLSEESSIYLYELALVNALSSFTELSRQIQGLRFTFWGAFALSDWAYPISLGHQNLKNPQRYFKLLNNMIEDKPKGLTKLERLKRVFRKKSKNIFRKEWRKSFRWMKKTHNIKQLTSSNRPLTTILSSAIMISEAKLGFLYAKFNTFTLTLNMIVENGGAFSRRFTKWVVLPLMRTIVKTPARSVSGIQRVLHKTLSIGDKQIEKIINGSKKTFNFCGYHLKNWSKEISKNVY